MAFIQLIAEALLGVQTELVVFVIALLAHTVLFGAYRWKPKSSKVPKGGLGAPQKGGSKVPGVAVLAATARQLLRQGAAREEMSKELELRAKGIPSKDLCAALASMLESVGRSASSELVPAVRSVAQQRGLTPSAPLAEALLRSCLLLRLQGDFKELLAEQEAAGQSTPAVAVLALRASLADGDLRSAVANLGRFSGPLKGSLLATPSSAPQHLLQQLLQLAAQESALPWAVRELAACGFLSPQVLETALLQSRGDLEGLRELESLASAEAVLLTDAASAALVRAAGTAKDALRAFAKAGERGNQVLLAGLHAATAHRSSALAEAAAQHLPATPGLEVSAALLRAAAQGLLQGRHPDAAVLRAYEEHMSTVDILADPQSGRLVAEAALRAKRPDLLDRLVQVAAEPSRRVALLKSFGADQRLADATAVFRACPEKTACLYNALLDACIDCQDMEAAERVMAEAVSADTADVVTYNTIIKKHLQRGHFQRARAVIESMRSAGGSFAPNSVTFNELIDATVRSNPEGAWVLLDEMKACGLRPTSVTCSILLKSIQRTSRPADVDRTMAFVDSMEDSMDEVLLSSVCEACVRAGRGDLLAPHLQRQRGSARVPVCGAHTFGSIIRAYGFQRDLDGAWEAWNDMRRQRVIPTSITIGCMVEAQVANGDPEAGYQLIHELAANDETKPLLNAVIYCSVLKGFTHQKAFSRVWVVYDEMISEKLQFSIVTYNALIDACARSAEMSRVPPLLEDMARQKIEPNLVTYSTILKGYCQESRLDKAFELLEAMKQSKQFMPDEITYNTLIDGCAQRGMYDQGMRLLEEMQQAGVPPSTFTLSVLVKLCNRGKRPERASELVEGLAQRFRLQLNIHVYDNLIHNCTAHGDLPGALQVLERMVQHKVRPDARTYTLLIRGCIEASALREAAGLVRLACGLRNLPPSLTKLSHGAVLLQLRGAPPADLAKEVLEAMVSWGGEEHLAMQLCKELKAVPGLKIDARFSMCLASKALRA